MISRWRLYDCISSFALHVWEASLMISHKHVPVVVVVAVVVVVVVVVVGAMVDMYK